MRTSYPPVLSGSSTSQTRPRSTNRSVYRCESTVGGFGEASLAGPGAGFGVAGTVAAAEPAAGAEAAAGGEGATVAVFGGDPSGMNENVCVEGLVARAAVPAFDSATVCPAGSGRRMSSGITSRLGVTEEQPASTRTQR